MNERVTWYSSPSSRRVTPAQRTVKRCARKRGRTKIVALPEGLRQAPGRAPAGALSPAPGTDLTESIAKADKDQVIVLGAGEYRGTLCVKDRKLTVIGQGEGKTVLTGGPGDAVIIVQGGTLEIENLTIRAAGKVGGVALALGAGLCRTCPQVVRGPTCRIG